MPTTHLLARAVIQDDDCVLVVQADGQSHTFLPGGHREPGEGLEECLSRELREELDVQLEVGRYLGGVEHRWMRDGERQYEINHCFSATTSTLSVSSSPQAQEDYLSFGWVRIDRLAEVNLQPAPLRALLVEAPEAPWWATTLTQTATRDVADPT